MKLMLDRGSSAFALVWIVATIKDLPSLELSFFNLALATSVAGLVMGGAALVQALDRRASAHEELGHPAGRRRIVG
jgi:hypothetical protein